MSRVPGEYESEREDRVGQQEQSHVAKQQEPVGASPECSLICGLRQETRPASDRLKAGQGQHEAGVDDPRENDVVERENAVRFQTVRVVWCKLSPPSVALRLTAYCASVLIKNR